MNSLTLIILMVLGFIALTSMMSGDDSLEGLYMSHTRSTSNNSANLTTTQLYILGGFVVALYVYAMWKNRN